MTSLQNKVLLLLFCLWRACWRGGIGQYIRLRTPSPPLPCSNLHTLLFLSISRIIIVLNYDHDHSLALHQINCSFNNKSGKFPQFVCGITQAGINFLRVSDKMAAQTGLNKIIRLLLVSLIVQTISNNVSQCSKINISHLWNVHWTFDNWMRR